MFRSSHCDYTYFEGEDDSDSDTDLTGAFAEASDTDGSSGTDSYVISGPKTPEQQMAAIKSKLDAGNLDMAELEKLIDQLNNVRLEGVPSLSADKFDMLLSRTSNVIGDMGNVQFSTQIYSGMADLGIAPKYITPAPAIQQVSTFTQQFDMTG